MDKSIKSSIFFLQKIVNSRVISLIKIERKANQVCDVKICVQFFAIDNYPLSDRPCLLISISQIFIQD